MTYLDLRIRAGGTVRKVQGEGIRDSWIPLQPSTSNHGISRLLVADVPPRQFGGQEPGTDEEIAQFCSLNHGVTFPLMKKSDVNGDNTNEVYKYLKEQKSGLLGLTRIKVRL